jgi:hypothetical protein
MKKYMYEEDGVKFIYIRPMHIKMHFVFHRKYSVLSLEIQTVNAQGQLPFNAGIIRTTEEPCVDKLQNF